MQNYTTIIGVLTRAPVVLHRENVRPATMSGQYLPAYSSNFKNSRYTLSDLEKNG